MANLCINVHRATLRLDATILIIIDLVIRCSSAFQTGNFNYSGNQAGILDGVGGSDRPFILPLSFSSPSSSLRRAPDRSNRRHLQRANAHNISNARMPLYDDLLLHGYYTARLFIGTPSQEFALIVDTGSTVTYVPCSSCRKCGRHQDPRFQPELSRTYKPVKCNIDCNCDDEREQCTYERRYAEMSTSSGVLGEDIISFGIESELKPQHVVFGCENVETGDLFSQRADGIMGLGRGQLSIVDQMVEKGAIGDSFSLCYGGMDIGGGAMILGVHSLPHDMVFTPSDPSRSPYYNIELKGIHVAGKPLKLIPKVFDGRHGTVLDSGTTYAYFPEEAFIAFKNAIVKNIHPLKQIPGPDPNYNDICFAGAGRDVSQLSKTFPEAEMVFSNGQKLSLSPENYLFRHTKVHGAYCLGIFPNGKDPTTLLGGIIVRNTLVTYDRANERVGFWKTNCSELWKSLHVPVCPTPVGSVSCDKNTTVELPPAQAPSEQIKDIFSGEFRVGLIIFDLSFVGANSSVNLNITQLAEFMATELKVDVSQVHSLNYTFEGNHFLVRWAIYPVDSASYITDTKARSIIQCLTEHRLQFPGWFGSYQLVELKVEPQSRWKPPLLAVFIGSCLTLAIVLSSIGIRFLRRHREQALTTYKPVSTAVPEQELQPL
ncbi:hypothetical protein Nepgr_019805 [Nepenthes gracilis]|uniref:Peptidase A1 domain-containing protein n=1 Tax=Nepenthes gracilis TaxID=150966 RepID=A0AAD3SVU8_NEPGR|nr:hypothetical protein Nepgr_019805 [Nepenthes gracilis]